MRTTIRPKVQTLFPLSLSLSFSHSNMNTFSDFFFSCLFVLCREEWVELNFGRMNSIKHWFLNVILKYSKVLLMSMPILPNYPICSSTSQIAAVSFRKSVSFSSDALSKMSLASEWGKTLRMLSLFGPLCAFIHFTEMSRVGTYRLRYKYAIRWLKSVLAI